MRFFSVLILLLFFLTDLHLYGQGYVSFKVETQRLHQKKVVSSNYEVLINCDNANMIIHYYPPNEFYIFTNGLGEMKAYYPKKNEVIRQQNNLFSSNNDPVYQFFTNQAQDLGLSQMGFTISNSQLDGQYLVTTWSPPISLMDQLLSVKLVQENYLPIYVSYTDTKNKEKQKIYFSDWNTNSIAIYPQRITQIDYLPDNDSIISKKTYSLQSTGEAALNRFPKVDIPSNAKLVKALNNSQ